MAISDHQPADKQNRKNGYYAVITLLVIFVVAPVLIAEITGVNISELCVDDSKGIGNVLGDDDEEQSDECEKVIDNSKIETALQGGMRTLALAVSILSFVLFIVVSARY